MDLKDIEDMATKSLEKDGNMMGQILIPLKDRLEVYPLMFKNDEEKEEILKILRLRVSVIKPENYFFMTEGWVGGNPNIKPSQDKNKKEAVIISEYRKDMKNKTIMKFFHKERNKIVWDGRNEFDDNMQSRFNFFMEDASKEYNEIHTKEYNERKIMEQFDSGKFDELMETAKKELGEEKMKELGFTKEILKQVALKMVREGKIRYMGDEHVKPQ